MQCMSALLGRYITISRNSSKRQKLEQEKLNYLGHLIICFLVAWLLHLAPMTCLLLPLLCLDTEDLPLIQHLIQAAFSTHLPVILVSRMCVWKETCSDVLTFCPHCYLLMVFQVVECLHLGATLQRLVDQTLLSLVLEHQYFHPQETSLLSQLLGLFMIPGAGE